MNSLDDLAEDFGMGFNGAAPDGRSGGSFAALVFDTAPESGYPQAGHETDLSDMSLPHSGQVVMAVVFSR